MKKLALLFQHYTHEINEAGELTFYDYPEIWDLQVGDLIQYRTSLMKTKLYEVTEVKPAMLKQFPDRMKKVTAREKV